MYEKNLDDLISRYIATIKIISKEKINDNNEIRKLIIASVINNLILSKKLFKRNAQIEEFLKNQFQIELKKYMLTSRTLLCGKVTKTINEINDEEKLETLLNNLYNILIKILKFDDMNAKDIYDVIREMKF